VIEERERERQRERERERSEVRERLSGEDTSCAECWRSAEAGDCGL
jgi:hypothetical protein